MKKTALLLILMATVLALASTSFAATSVASLNGTYNFQVYSVKSQYGYYCAPGQTGNCSWHNLGNGACPAKYTCQNIYVQDVAVGTLYFNGKGGAEFTSFADSQGGGGPKVNVVYTYKVSGFTASMVIPAADAGGGTNSPTITMSLGNFNAAGVAQTVLLLVTNTGDSGNSALGGMAVLQ